MDNRICLIVDDEPAIRTYLRLILEREHIQVLEAGTAPQALRIINQLGSELALVVTDINMPGDLNGLDLAYSLRNAWPALPVILITGYGDDESVTRAALVFRFIRKPFVPQTFLNAALEAMELNACPIYNAASVAPSTH